MPDIETSSQTLISEITLKDFLEIIWFKRTWLLFSIIAPLGFSVLVSFSIPDVYESQAIVAPKQTGTDKFSQMAAQYAGLASLAGINIGESGGEVTKDKIAVETMKTHRFFTKYLYEDILPELMAVDSWDASKGELLYDEDLYEPTKNLWLRRVSAPLQKKPSPQEAYRVFEKRFNISENRRTGILNLSISHQSPKVAASWLALIIRGINESMRERDISEARRAIEFLIKQRADTNLVQLDQVFAQLIEEQTKTIMLANVTDEYILQTIEPPIVSDLKSSPNRVVIVVSVTVAGFFLMVLLILALHYSKVDLSKLNFIPKLSSEKHQAE